MSKLEGTRRAAAAAAVLAVAALAGCHACHDDDADEDEEDQRASFWRASVVIDGAGTVETQDRSIVCASLGGAQLGACGPNLFVFSELRPPLLHATAAPGWRFARWSAVIRARDGSLRARPGRMPDSAFYLDGFGYRDTGELETVTAIFVRDASRAR